MKIITLCGSLRFQECMMRTNLEIEYAKKLNKEILYYTDLIKNKTIKI